MHAVGEMIERADAAGRDDRDADRVGDRAGELEIEALAGAVAVHGGEQDFAGAQRHDFAREGHRVDAGRIPPAMGEDLPLAAAPSSLASMATTMHWLPNFSAARLTKSRSFTAAVLIETLSAPASSSLRMSSTWRTPPPTVSGMKQASAVRCTTSKMMPRFSWLAVMSRKQSSSAPAAS